MEKEQHMVSASKPYAAARLPRPLRITEQLWPEGTVPVVTIRCITYNHEKFIRDAIEGFLMQETTFPVEIIVHDDASTDGTADIIREYATKHPQLFVPILQSENLWSRGRNLDEFIDPLIRGEFIALCEGDDYWTSPQKLQKQIDLLLLHPEGMMSGSRCFVIEEPATAPYRIEPAIPGSVAKTLQADDYLSGKSFFRMPTRVLRTTLFQEFSAWRKDKDLGTGDWCMFLYCAWKCSGKKHGILFIDEPLAVYREYLGGMWTRSTSADKAVRSLQDLKYIIPLAGSHPARHHLVGRRDAFVRMLAHSPSLSSGQRIRFCLKGLAKQPLSVALWKSLLAALRAFLWIPRRRPHCQ